MFHLPLFPLNTVLFPGMPLHLHIFEPRYQRMVQDCMEGDRTFGVALIRRGVEAWGPLAEPHDFGCTVRILETVPLRDNRMNLVAVGQERIRIYEVDGETRPYLTGKVAYQPLKVVNADTLESYARALRPWVQRYLDLLARASDPADQASELPQEALPLVYLGAILLQMPPDSKQKLLEMELAENLAENLLSLYRRELGLLRAMLEAGKESPGPFSTS